MKLRVLAYGEVVKVGEPQSFTFGDGRVAVEVDVYVASPDPLQGAGRLTCPVAMTPLVGEHVQYVVDVEDRLSKAGRSWLSVKAVERVQKDEKPVKAVS
jgi:hypothetical protein